MQNTDGASTPVNANVMLNLTKDQGEKKPSDIKGCNAIGVSMMYVAVAIGPNISFAVAALCQYNSCSSPIISPLPKVNSSISNPPPSFDYTLAGAAQGAMINSLSTRTPIHREKVWHYCKCHLFWPLAQDRDMLLMVPLCDGTLRVYYRQLWDVMVYSVTFSLFAKYYGISSVRVSTYAHDF
jgi:hypothetical protein